MSEKLVIGSREWWNAQPLGEISDVQLSKKIGYGVRRIAKERAIRYIRHATPKKRPPHPSELLDWEAIDWKKSTRDIAYDTGFSMSLVRSKRKLYSKEPPVERCPTSKVDWHAFHWATTSIRAIADETGFSPETVRKKRTECLGRQTRPRRTPHTEILKLLTAAMAEEGPDEELLLDGDDRRAVHKIIQKFRNLYN